MTKQKETMSIENAMPALDFNFQLKKSNGKDIGSMRELVAEALESYHIPELPRKKQIIWATQLSNKTALQLDSVDYEILKNFCTDEKSNVWSPLSTVRLTEYFENLND